MFARHYFATAALLLAAASAQSSTLLASDNFDTAATGWAGGWTTSSAASIATTGAGSGLVFSGASNNTNAATRELASTVNARKVMLSFDLQFKGGSIDNNDFLALWLGNSSGANFGIKGNCGTGSASCNDADLFVRSGPDSFTMAMTLGTTYHLFAVLEKLNGAAVYNRYSLWVDPTQAEMSGLTGADAISNGSTGLSSFSTVGFRTANLDAGDVFVVDNLTVSEVPEPGTFALAGLALAGLAASRRRRG